MFSESTRLAISGARKNFRNAISGIGANTKELQKVGHGVPKFTISFLAPLGQQTSHGRFGMNVSFGCKPSRRYYVSTNPKNLHFNIAKF